MEIIHTLCGCVLFALLWYDSAAFSLYMLQKSRLFPSKNQIQGIAKTHCIMVTFICYKSLLNIISYRLTDSGETAFYAAPTGHAKTLRQKGPCHDDTL